MKLSKRSLLAASLILPARIAAANQAKPVPWPTALLMATGRPGGAYDIYGPAWGRVVQGSCGLSVAYRASGGAAADILLIEQGAAQLGMTTVTVADQARAGTGAWTAGVKLNDFRALFPIFPSTLQIVTLGSHGVLPLGSLENSVIGIGPDGGSGSAIVPMILAKLGIRPSRIVTGDYAPQIHDMLAGNIAACAFIGAPPLPAILSAAQSHTLGLIGFTQAEAAIISNSMPGLTRMLIPAGTFPRQALPVASIGTANYAIGAPKLPASLVNAITLAAMRHQASLAQAVPAAATPPQAMLSEQEIMIFHPGAAMALRSLGLNIPAKSVAS